MDEIQTYEWTNAIDFTSSNKYVFQICFQCTIFVCEMYELLMNKFCMISIIKLWNAKFVTGTTSTTSQIWKKKP
jgi:hypothetical protein